jgi:hypothetical protein
LGIEKRFKQLTVDLVDCTVAHYKNLHQQGPSLLLKIIAATRNNKAKKCRASRDSAIECEENVVQ